MTLYIGIDLSTDPSNTGIAVLTDNVNQGIATFGSGEFQGRWCGTVPEWDGERNPEEAEFTTRAERIVNIINRIVGITPQNMEQRVIVAIDVPFGWPKDFKLALQNHKPGGHTTNNDRNFSYRLTENIIKSNSRLHPLSGSTDKLGRTALLGSLIVHRLTNQDDRFDVQLRNQIASERKIIEVYPTATAYALAQNEPEASFTLRTFYQNLNGASWILESQNIDKYDAVVAAFTAYLFSMHFEVFNWPIPGGDRVIQDLVNHYVSSEGWIWAPFRLRLNNENVLRNNLLARLGELLRTARDNPIPRP